MKKTTLAKLATCILLAPLVATPALAQSPSQIKQNKAWGSYSHNTSDGKVCFVLSVPTEKLPVKKGNSVIDHGEIYFTLTKRPGQNVRLEPQFKAGYSLQENSKVTIDIDGKKFLMFSRGPDAWLENPAEETAIINSMRAGSKMKIFAASRRGTKTNYTYSLSGVTASLNDISNCK